MFNYEALRWMCAKCQILIGRKSVEIEAILLQNRQWHLYTLFAPFIAPVGTF